MKQPAHFKASFCRHVSHPPERFFKEKIKKYSVYFFTIFFVIILFSIQVLALEDNASTENAPELSSELPETANEQSFGEDIKGIAVEESLENSEGTLSAAQNLESSKASSKSSMVGKTVIYCRKKRAGVYSDKEAKHLIAYLSRGAEAKVLEEVDGKYRIKSGSVEGYVKKTRFTEASKTKEKKYKTSQKQATVKRKNVRMFKTRDTESKVKCVLPKGASFKVIKQGKKFTKILVPGVGKGWVLNSRISVKTVKKHAVSIAEKKQLRKKIRAGIKKAKKIEKKKKSPAYIRKAICAYAKQFVGVLPYMSGGSDLKVGVDCSGFTRAIYLAFGIEIPRSPADQAAQGKAVSMDNIQPGDIVYYSGHVGLYVGKNKIIHAPVPGQFVSYADIDFMPIIKVVRFVHK